MKRLFAAALLYAIGLPAEDRQTLLRRFESTAGPLPVFEHAAPLDIQVIEEIQVGNYRRRKITYSSPDGDRVPAYLLLPDAAGKLPAMLCLHQTTKIGKGEPAGLGGKPNLHYAEELAQRGYVALVPDYPSFGDYEYAFDRPPYRSGTMKGIVNHMRGVDLLASLPNVDAARIGVIGHSLGGHNSLFVAAMDPRLRAVVTSCGFTAMAKYKGGNLKGWDQDRYMPLVRERYHNSPAELPWDFTDILGAIAPRAIFINAPLHDDNFEVSGVDDVVGGVRSQFPAADLVLVHPDSAHDFPPEIREQAYQFLDRHLRK